MSTEVQNLDLARKTHHGVFITGPGKLELLEDTLPESSLQGEHIITESLGNCRCSSDKKAIRQFTEHARIPSNATQVALGHETVQQVVFAPANSPVATGDLVYITPGHFNAPHNPDTFEPDSENGVIASLGYSYRYMGGLRQLSAIPLKAINVVREQGLGNLFNRLPEKNSASLATLAHAEPFACCYGTIRNMFYRSDSGEFSYGIPSRARVAFLGGTARMAMIKLTILAAFSDADLPERVAITGSKTKLEALTHYAVVENLRERGVEIILIDRRAPDIVDQLLAPGKYNAVFTNFPSQEVFDQAVAIIEFDGNLNNYAGAVDPEIYLEMEIGPVDVFASHDEEARTQIAHMHHNVAPYDPERYSGIAREGWVAFLGFAAQDDRLRAYLKHLPEGSEVVIEGHETADLADDFPGLRFVGGLPLFSDVFIAGTGDAAAETYVLVETRLARSAAVNLVDGATTIRMRSKHLHYASRHQICGSTVAYTLTNTSEPVSEDMAIQGANPIDFDWMVKGVSGLDHAIEMIDDVTENEHFGSFFAMAQIEDFPYVTVSSAAFTEKARERGDDSSTVKALEAGAAILERNGETWSREVEEAIYAAFGVEYPLHA